MSIMAWYLLPQSGSAPSPGDEFFENQSAGWSLWSFTSSDDQNTAASAAACSVKQERGAAHSDEQSVLVPLEPHQWAHPTDDIFLSQFSDEEMRRMDAPFEALDMFPDSMHRLLSYEDMLSGVLTGNSSEGQDRNGVDTMDTCGFPLFSHDLQSAELNSSEQMVPADTMSVDKDGVGTVKRSRSFADAESPRGLEALVLEDFEDVVFQMTKKTRICFRDAFFRLAECSSQATRCTSSSSRQSVRQAAEGNVSRVPSAAAAGSPPERGTNAIDRTVADMTMRPPYPAPLQVHGSCFAGGEGATAQSATGWTARA